VRDYTPAMAADICGVKADDIVTAARWFGQAPAALSLYCQGLNQSSHGTDNNAALIHLHLATGKIGKPGCGPFSLTGQPNAMGGREVGGLANLLSAHRDLANPEHRAEVARLWGVPEVPAEARPDRGGTVRGRASRRDQGLWIACTNPAQSLPDRTRVHEALAAAPSSSCRKPAAAHRHRAYADLLLPAAGWGEKEGTVTNSERRISRVRAAVPPPGEARADWRSRGFRAAAGKPALSLAKGGRYDAVSLCERRGDLQRAPRHTVGRDLDIGGLSYACSKASRPAAMAAARRRQPARAPLRRRGVPHASGRARFRPTQHRPTGRSHRPAPSAASQHRPPARPVARHEPHRRRAAPARPCPGAVLEMNGRDMERRGIADGDLVRVKGKRGALLLRAAASNTLRPAQTYLPMHWGGRFMSGLGVNAPDAGGHRPGLAPARTQARGGAGGALRHRLAAGGAAPRRPGGLHAALQPWLAPLRPRHADPCRARIHGRRAARLGRRRQPLPTPDLLRELAAAMGLDTPHMLAFNDARRGIAKRALIEDDRLAGALLCNETRATDWLLDLIARGGSTAELRKWLFARLRAPPAAGPARGRIVCNCFDVSESEIRADLASRPRPRRAAGEAQVRHLLRLLPARAA
jgi:assimilatory nitrate reductase catalytic subunit